MIVVRESFSPWPQHSEPGFVPTEVRHKIGTGGPGVTRVCVEGREDVEQVFDIRVLR